MIDVDQSQTRQSAQALLMEWQPIETAPFGRNLELAVIDATDAYALVFPCRRARVGWIKSTTGVSVNVHPTHWREWTEPTVPARVH